MNVTFERVLTLAQVRGFKVTNCNVSELHARAVREIPYGDWTLNMELTVDWFEADITCTLFDSDTQQRKGIGSKYFFAYDGLARFLDEYFTK